KSLAAALGSKDRFVAQPARPRVLRAAQGQRRRTNPDKPGLPLLIPTFTATTLDAHTTLDLLTAVNARLARPSQRTTPEVQQSILFTADELLERLRTATSLYD